MMETCDCMHADAYSVCTRDRERLTNAVEKLTRQNERFREALNEIVFRESTSTYSSIYAAPGEFAMVAREALHHGR